VHDVHVPFEPAYRAHLNDAGPDHPIALRPDHETIFKSRNTNAAAPTKVGITSNSRFMMYRYIASLPQRCLLVEPDGRQVLVEIMAGTDPPALHI
jgi:hypothetical protein